MGDPREGMPVEVTQKKEEDELLHLEVEQTTQAHTSPIPPEASQESLQRKKTELSGKISTLAKEQSTVVQALKQGYQTVAYDFVFAPAPTVASDAGKAKYRRPPKSSLREKRHFKKAREKQLKELSGTMLNVDSLEEMANLRESDWGQNVWLKQKKGELTYAEILEEVQQNNFAHFEQLDVPLRNELASRWMRQNFNPAKGQNAMQYVNARFHQGGVAALMHPLFRLGISLGIHQNGIGIVPADFLRQVDEACGTVIMGQTLKSRVGTEERDALKSRLRVEYPDDSDAALELKIDEAVRKERLNKQFIAKSLFLTHMGRMKKHTTHPDDKKKVDVTEWEGDITSAFTHCSRVIYQMPEQKDAEGYSELDHQNMWDRIYKLKDGTTPLVKRGASTHNIQRRRVDGKKKFRELKQLFNLSGQFGTNVAVGGLGKKGLSQGQNVPTDVLANDGSCGHVYTMHKKSEKGKQGGMLLGFESDAYKKTNQLGHRHGFGNGEFASSFGGQRTDEIGDKYHGRVVDLTGYSPLAISHSLEGLEQFLKDHSSPDATGEQLALHDRVVDLLTGPLMAKEDFDKLNSLLQSYHLAHIGLKGEAVTPPTTSDDGMTPEELKGILDELGL